eukprot:13304895-Alexandrium_andersonii.AAC.1
MVGTSADSRRLADILTGLTCLARAALAWSLDEVGKARLRPSPNLRVLEIKVARVSKAICLGAEGGPVEHLAPSPLAAAALTMGFGASSMQQRAKSSA